MPRRPRSAFAWKTCYDTLGTRRANTQVLVKDGETVVIGGLLSTRKEANRDRVPFLSRIPIMGLLFKSKEDISEYKELIIFITPRRATEVGELGGEASEMKGKSSEMRAN
jgi:type IV pilus assembly protein PilQ